MSAGNPWSAGRPLSPVETPAEGVAQEVPAAARPLPSAYDAAAAPTTPTDLRPHLLTEFVGQRGDVFGLAFRAGVITILTLGFYRFWMKTRLRRWYWSSIRPGGVPMEYTGDPVEKLLGFLMAVVVMAFYIGIVNLILMFVSFSLLANNFAAYAVSFLGVIPIWFYALYRSRRYVLARTRWSGIRFGLDQGAWGYAGRALVHWLVTICTLGLLWPRMTFYLEKYITDRTWFGTARLEQGGHWQMLYRPFIAVIIPILLGAAALGFGIMTGQPSYFASFGGSLIWFLFAMIYYRVASQRIMANHKRAGTIGLQSKVRATRVVGIYVGGYFLTYLSVLIPAGIMAVVFFGLDDPVSMAKRLQDGRWFLILTTAIFYFGIFLMWSVLQHTFVTMPLWRHYAETLTILGADGLVEVRQRPRDEFSEAEGFAEALDLGAAI